LRIGWAIQAGDLEAFRRAVRLSYALWGGRFNPILIANYESGTKRLVDLFRVDVIWPVGEGAEVKALPEKFPYLINAFVSGCSSGSGNPARIATDHISHIVCSYVFVSGLGSGSSERRGHRG